MCFFHRQAHEQKARIAADHFAQSPFDVPVLEDANSIQVALMQVMQMLAMRRIEHKTASLLLYALQTATSNVRNTKFEPRTRDVVIDRDTVHLTAIDGPQWFESDFDEEEEEDDEEIGEEEESGEEEDDAEAESENEEKEDEAEVPVPAAKAAQAAPNPGKRPAIRAGESPVDAMKRILAEAEARQQSG